MNLREAWEYVENNFKIKNVYDAYALNEDYYEQIDIINNYYRIVEDLQDVEEAFSILNLRDRLASLYDKLELFSTSPLAYKYTFPKELSYECTLATKEIQEQINQLEQELDDLLDKVFIDDEILGIKK